jgi:hypothetical protein
MRALLALAFVVACAPATEGEGEAAHACGACVAEKCQDLVDACTPVDECECMVDCLGRESIAHVDACPDACGIGEKPARFLDVEECAAAACPDEGDECAVPADYEPPDDGTVLTTTDDIGGGTEADCGLDRSLAYDPNGAVLQLESFDGHVCARLERIDEGPGELANTSWRLVDARVGPLGRVAHVTDDACWYSSHHNFADLAHVWTGSRHIDVHLEEFGHDGARTYSLTSSEGPAAAGDCGAARDGTAIVGEPLELFPVNP